MKVLVTGGTGVVGKAAVDRLLGRGHTVRLFSRHADRDSGLWAVGVEPYPGSIASDSQVRGAAEGCDAVLHIAGVVDEVPPEVTFEIINVQGTRRIVDEATRAGVGRLVYVSSLGAGRGSSAYHRSKRAGEEHVREFAGNWLICRPGNVYGPGDEVISLLLKVVRAMPVVPVIGGGSHAFQPIAVDDLAQALALAVEREEPRRRILELAGAETITMDELLDLLEEITRRSPRRLPIPDWMALAGAQLADRVGLEVPVNAHQITMLLEENVIGPGEANALIEVFGVEATPLREGLANLAGSLPEKLPSQGVGPMHRQRYWADILDSRLDPDTLFATVCSEFSRLPPRELIEIGAEPGTPTGIAEGATLTMAVPLRGHIQVRVEEVRDRAITCVTVEGHHLAGVIRFGVRPLDDRIRFEVRSYARASDLLDSVGMAALGRRMQKSTWRAMVEAVVSRCEGRAVDGVREEAAELTPREAGRVERWVERLVTRRKREEGSGTAAANPHTRD